MERSQRFFRRRAKERRAGYVLVMCLLVVAISSAIVLTLFNVLRLQTAESTARRRMTVSAALSDAATEHAIAILLDQPNFRGTIGPITVPVYTDRSYVIQIADAGSDILVTSLSTSDGIPYSISRLVRSTDLDDRRARLGL